jgi:hypothetical protein
MKSGKKLSQAEWNELYNAWSDVVNLEPGSSMTGRHWLLMATLERLGYKVRSTIEAREIAEYLLWEQSEE